MADEFEVGVGKVNITPPLSFPYLGFHPRHAFFKGVHDDLYVRSLVVSCEGNEVAIVASDTFGFRNRVIGKGRDFTEEVRKRVEETTGIRGDHVMLTGSHIHSTPDTLGFRPLDEKAAMWLEALMEQIASSVMLAHENRFKADLKVGRGDVKGVSKNRRGGECLDTEVITVLFESAERNVLMVNFACHPVIVQVQDLVSADYVGVLEGTVEKTLEGVEGCLFLQGACGDINPVMGNTRNFRDVYFVGMALAGEVIKTYSLMALPGYPKQPAKLKVVSERVNLPSRPLPTLEEAERAFEEAKKRFEMAEGREERDRARRAMRITEEVLFRVKEGKGPFEAEIQAVRMGNALLIGIPGEPFCQMGATIKEISRPLVGVPVGYTNGYLGYIAPPEAWERGGYEVSCGPWSKVGPEAYGMLIEVFKRIKRRME